MRSMSNRNFLTILTLAAVTWGFACVGVYETFVDSDPELKVAAMAADMHDVAADMRALREEVEAQAPGMVPGTACTVTLNASTATKIECGVGQRAYECTVDSAETDTVYVGGTALSTSNYRRTASGGDVFGSDLKFEYGLSSSGNITLHCSSAVQ